MGIVITSYFTSSLDFKVQFKKYTKILCAGIGGGEYALVSYSEVTMLITALKYQLFCELGPTEAMILMALF